jgi:hypothetical protein
MTAAAAQDGGFGFIAAPPGRTEEGQGDFVIELLEDDSDPRLTRTLVERDGGP